MKTRHKVGVVAIILAGALVLAGPIKSWSAGEYITSSDLNAALSHIHTTMVGGHGPRLTNADVSGTAAIAHSKLATPAVIPKAWAAVTAICSGGACTVGDSYGISSISAVDAGVYVVNYSITTRPNTNYAAFALQNSSNLGTRCHTFSREVTKAYVTCNTLASGAQSYDSFDFLLLDTQD